MFSNTLLIGSRLLETIERTNTLSLISLKLYIGFLGASNEALSSCIFCDSQGHTFPVIFFNYTKVHVVKKDQSRRMGPHRLISPRIMIITRNLNDKFIHQQFGQASHQCILKMAKLGIYIGLPKYIPKLSHPFRACITSKGTHLPCHPNVSTKHLDPGTHFHPGFRFFSKVSYQKYTSALTVVDSITSHLFV